MTWITVQGIKVNTNNIAWYSGGPSDTFVKYGDGQALEFSVSKESFEKLVTEAQEKDMKKQAGYLAEALADALTAPRRPREIQKTAANTAAGKKPPQGRSL